MGKYQVSDGPKIPPEFGYHESLIFNCYESALEKLDFLHRIPEFMQGLVHGDIRLEAALGPGLVNALYNLRIGQLKHHRGIGIEEYEHGFVDSIKNTHAPDSDERNYAATPIEIRCQLELEKASLTPPISMNEALNLKWKKKSSDGISFPAAAERIEEDAISGNITKNLLFGKLVMMQEDLGPTRTFSPMEDPKSTEASVTNDLSRCLHPQKSWVIKVLDAKLDEEIRQDRNNTSHTNSSEESDELEQSSTSDAAYFEDQINKMLKKEMDQSSTRSHFHMENENDKDNAMFTLETIPEPPEGSATNSNESINQNLKTKNLLVGGNAGIGDGNFSLGDDDVKILAEGFTENRSQEVVDHEKALRSRTRSEIQRLYGEVFREFGKSNFRISIPLTSSSKRSTNSPVERFRKSFLGLGEVLRKRLFTCQRLQDLEHQRNCWYREKSCSKEMKVLKERQSDIFSKWDQRMAELRDEVKSVSSEIEDCKHQGLNHIKEIMNKLLAKLQQKKRSEAEMVDITIAERKFQNLLKSRHQDFITRERGSRQKILTLEDSLQRLLDSYSEEMVRKQTELDYLENAVEQNKKKIVTMERNFAETEERFDEMRITKRLKEILKNMEMADNFKRNRAARIIQAAWRRYRFKKLRKMRRKAKLRRKPKIPGQGRTIKERSGDRLSSDVSSVTTGRNSVKCPIGVSHRK